MLAFQNGRTANDADANFYNVAYNPLVHNMHDDMHCNNLDSVVVLVTSSVNFVMNSLECRFHFKPHTECHWLEKMSHSFNQYLTIDLKEQDLLAGIETIASIIAPP